MKDQNKQIFKRQTCKHMVPKCKERPAKDRKEDKNTDNLIHGKDMIGR